MKLPQQDARLGRQGRPAPIDVEVGAVESPVGGFVRVTFRGASLDSFRWPGPASHLKFFPPPGPEDQEPADPARRPLSRTYTPRSFDATKGELVVEFLLHGAGPAAAWARSAQVGARAKISLPRATWSPSHEAGWLLLGGDDSAVPAISTILEAGTPERTTVIIESNSSPLERPPTATGVSISWVPTDPQGPGRALDAAVREFVQPPGIGLVWVAGEALAVRQIRRHLTEDRLLSREAIVTRGYWRQGESNHPDHDFGVDEP
jgi:NADPH-dependent ferric siderophore reductase